MSFSAERESKREQIYVEVVRALRAIGLTVIEARHVGSTPNSTAFDVPELYAVDMTSYRFYLTGFDDELGLRTYDVDRDESVVVTMVYRAVDAVQWILANAETEK